MQIDYSYLATILESFLLSEKPVLDTDFFNDKIEDNGDKFFFHLVILSEQNLLSSALTNSTDLGIRYDFHSEEYNYSIVPLRLTAYGHDFANALNKPSVLEVIQTKFKNEGLSVVLDIAKAIVRKKAEELL
jgi:hypothetical protein